MVGVKIFLIKPLQVKLRFVTFETLLMTKIENIINHRIGSSVTRGRL